MDILHRVGITAPYLRRGGPQQASVVSDSFISNIQKTLPPSETRARVDSVSLKEPNDCTHLIKLQSELKETGQQIKATLQQFLDEKVDVDTERVKESRRGPVIGEREVCSAHDIWFSRQLKASLSEGDLQFKNNRFPVGWVQGLHRVSDTLGVWWRRIASPDSKPREHAREINLAQEIKVFLSALLEKVDQFSTADQAEAYRAASVIYESIAKVEFNWYSELSKQVSDCFQTLDKAIDCATKSTELFKSNSGVFDTTNYNHLPDFRLIHQHMKKSVLLLDTKIIPHYPSDKVRIKNSLSAMQEARQLLTQFRKNHEQHFDYHMNVEMDLLQMDLDLKVHAIANGLKNKTLGRGKLLQMHRLYQDVAVRIELASPKKQRAYRSSLSYIHAELSQKIPSCFTRLSCITDAPDSKEYTVSKARKMTQIKPDPNEEDYYARSLRLWRENRQLIDGHLSEGKVDVLDATSWSAWSGRQLNLDWESKEEDRISSRYSPKPLEVEHCDFTPKPGFKHLYEFTVDSRYLAKLSS